MPLILCSIAVALALCLPAATGASPGPVVARAAAGPIRIDGRLDEPTWTQAVFTDGLRMMNRGDEPATVQTRFALRLDAAYLYLAVVADEPRVGDLVTTSSQRDQGVWRDDCIELMIDPSGQRVEYFHFIVSASGTVYDAWMRQAGYVRAVAWDADVRAAVEIGQGRWSLELAVPLVAIGPFAAAGKPWAFNLTRARRAGGQEQLSTFAPLSGGFHQPAQYAPLEIDGVDLSPYRWRLSPERDTHLAAVGGDTLTYRARVTVVNATGVDARARLRARVDGRTGPWRPLHAGAGETIAVDLDVPGVEAGERTLRFELESDGVTRALLQRQAVLAYRPLSLRLLEPGYRDALYPSQRLDHLVVETRSDLPAMQLARLGLRLELRSRDGRRTLAWQDATAGPADTLRLPLPRLAPGRYPLRARLTDRHGGTANLVAAARETLRVVAPAGDEWRLDDGRLRHDGEPVVPFGWFSIPPEAMTGTDHAYRLMVAYNSQYQSVDEVRAFLDRVAAAGTQAAIYPYPYNAFISPASVWDQPLKEAERADLRARVRALKDHPGLFAWYIADEPELRPADPRRTDEIYQIIADEDPNHPCIMLNDTVAGIYRYAGGGDVLMPDPYPTFLQDGHAAQPLTKIGRFMDAAVDASDGWRGVWITPQGFNYGDYGRDNNRAPNFTELRNMTWQAVVHGARGFLWYTYSHAANYPALGLGMPWLSIEVDGLREAILADDARLDVGLDAPQPEQMHVAARRLGSGHLVLIAVNTSTEGQEAAIELVPAPAVDAFFVVSEARQVRLQADGVLRDHFPPDATHIYTTDLVLARRPTIRQIQARIDSADAARRRPGNLAFEAYGTRAEVSSRARFGSAPTRLFDGITGGLHWRDGTRGELPDWVTITWPRPQTIGRLVLFGNITAATAQIAAGDGWRDLPAQILRGDDHVELRLATAQETSVLRLSITDLTDPSDFTLLHEIEAYAR